MLEGVGTIYGGNRLRAAWYVDFRFRTVGVGPPFGQWPSQYRIFDGALTIFARVLNQNCLNMCFLLSPFFLLEKKTFE